MISTIITDVFNNSHEVKELTKGRYYPLVAPKDTEGTFITYRKVSMSSEYHKGQRTSFQDTFMVELIVWGDEPAEVLGLAQKVREVLEKERGTYRNRKIQWVKLVNSKEDTTMELEPLTETTFEIQIANL